MSTMRLWNDGWSFYKAAPGTELAQLEALGERLSERFAPVELPHDWLILQTENLYEDSFGWYRRILRVGCVSSEVHSACETDSDGAGGEPDAPGKKPEAPEETLAPGERIQLRFDGVYMDSTLYVNRRKAGDWKYGYSSFTMDVTELLRDGENEILLVARFRSPNSRWYSGAGIYRNVWLKKCARSYLPIDGTYVVSREAEGGFRMEIETEVAGRIAEGLRVRYRLWRQGEPVRELGECGVEALAGKPDEEAPGKGAGAAAAAGALTGGNSPEVTGKAGCAAFVEHPLLWEIDAPECYELTAELLDGSETDDATADNAGTSGAKTDNAGISGAATGTVLDVQRITVGFRTFCFDPEKGFFLNGRRVKIHGVCEHHDFGCLGAAFSESAMERKFRILRGMGVNAIRTSHNMPAPGLMELADRMGFLVLSESFDMWERSKTTYDYGRFFAEWAERDVRSWVRRDRNHPSLFLWSIGNEIYDTHADERGQEITRRLASFVREHDPKGNAPVTIGSNYMPWENARKCADIVKIAGYNYGEKYYEAHHAAHPDWVIYGSETGSIVQSRGIYHFPLAQSILADEDEQCSALGNSATSWGAKSIEACITDDRDAEFSFGQFLWTGFDYIGEPTPYHTKNSYFGQIDTAGFPKDAYYLFQAAWTDVRENPMVHLFPWWDFNEGQLIDVRACTNGASVELFVNGVSRGRQAVDHLHGKKLLGDWQVAYEPGELLAVAYDAEGREIARESRHSFGDSAAITLEADRRELSADGEELCFVTVGTVDADGYPVENAVDYVKVTVEGPGRLLGLDNGDSTDYDSYKGNCRKLFSGKLLAVIGAVRECAEEEACADRPAGNPGEIVVCVESAFAGESSGGSRTTDGENDASVINSLCPAQLRIRVREAGSKQGKSQAHAGVPVSGGAPVRAALREQIEVSEKDAGQVELSEKDVGQVELREKDAPRGVLVPRIPVRKICLERIATTVHREETSETAVRRNVSAECGTNPAGIITRHGTPAGGAPEPACILDPEHPSFLLAARILPAGAEAELLWEAVNDGGIPVSFAGVEISDQGQARVEAFGDGRFRVRCLAKEPDGRITAISQLECEARGLGKAFLDPYGFVSAGLYAGSIGEIGNGNEKGIATARDGESGVYFEGVDFGSFGSDLLTLSVFALSDADYEIDLWLGVPYGEGSRKLQTLHYQKPSRWNVYQPETYRLSERIRGIATVGFVLRDKVHLKGFSFEKAERAFAHLSAGEADRIYGDSFRRDGSSVRNIGNNVTLRFEGMDFGEKGAESIAICGRTPLAKNTIHIRFTPEDGETVAAVAEFEGSGEPVGRVFPVDGFRGKGTVEFLFLPGSSFDFESFAFGASCPK